MKRTSSLAIVLIFSLLAPSAYPAWTGCLEILKALREVQESPLIAARIDGISGYQRFLTKNNTLIPSFRLERLDELRAFHSLLNKRAESYETHKRNPALTGLFRHIARANVSTDSDVISTVHKLARGFRDEMEVSPEHSFRLALMLMAESNPNLMDMLLAELKEMDASSFNQAIATFEVTQDSVARKNSADNAAGVRNLKDEVAGLQTQVTELKDKLLFRTVAGSVLFVLGFIVVVPQGGQIEKLKRDVVTVEEDAEKQNKNRKREIESLERDLKKLSQQVEALEKP